MIKKMTIKKITRNEIDNAMWDICCFMDEYREEIPKADIKKINEALSIVNAFIVNKKLK